MGLFNGELRPEEVFPFPEVLTEEQAQNTAMFIDPITRFYEVQYILSARLLSSISVTSI